jgi:hypothetical protein
MKVFDSPQIKYGDRRPPKYMPMMFKVCRRSEDNESEHEKTVVNIASFHYCYYPHEWWCDYQDFLVLRPDIDLIAETHEFESEEEAIEFVCEWWTLNPPLKNNLEGEV